MNEALIPHVLTFGMLLDDLVYFSVARLRNVDSTVTTAIYEDPAFLLGVGFGSAFFHILARLGGVHRLLW